MGQPVGTRQGKLAGRGKHDAQLGRVVQVKKRGGGSLHLSLVIRSFELSNFLEL